jgi:hypothetical protein
MTFKRVSAADHWYQTNIVPARDPLLRYGRNMRGLFRTDRGQMRPFYGNLPAHTPRFC